MDFPDCQDFDARINMQFFSVESSNSFAVGWDFDKINRSCGSEEMTDKSRLIAFSGTFPQEAFRLQELKMIKLSPRKLAKKGKIWNGILMEEKSP